MDAGTIALNATGGTKPMSIAAYEVFRTFGLPIFYVHPEQDRLIWMHPSGRPAVDLANRLDLEPFLRAHGASVTGGAVQRRPAPAAGAHRLAGGQRPLPMAVRWRVSTIWRVPLNAVWSPPRWTPVRSVTSDSRP